VVEVFEADGRGVDQGSSARRRRRLHAGLQRPQPREGDMSITMMKFNCQQCGALVRLGLRSCKCGQRFSGLEVTPPREPLPPPRWEVRPPVEQVR